MQEWGRDKKDKEEANQLDRKAEDENQTKDASEETVQKRDNRNFTVWLWEGVTRRSQAFSVWPICSRCLWKLQWRQWGLRTESHSRPPCEEESNQHWSRRCKIRSEKTSLKKNVVFFLSLQLKISSSWYWDKRCGGGAWPWSRTSSCLEMS
jgi:hypothetical protein